MFNVAAIKTMLWSFELVSDLKINFAKSCFGAFGVSEEWVKNAADRLLLLPFSYLGIPIGTNPRWSKTWDPIIVKCEKRLNKWRQRYLSFGGRVTLIKSILNSIPIFYFSFFRVPKKVVLKLEGLQRRFLWGGNAEHKKIPWISWETICLPKERGGLGVRELIKFNCALLGTWRWNLFHHEGKLCGENTGVEI